MTFIPSPPPLSRLTPLQVSLLRMFDHGLTEEQTQELQRVLVAHYSQQLQDEVERIDAERNYTTEDFERMLNAPS